MTSLQALTPDERIPIEAQIAHFGQTPLQLIKGSHPEQAMTQTLTQTQTLTLILNLTLTLTRTLTLTLTHLIKGPHPKRNPTAWRDKPQPFKHKQHGEPAGISSPAGNMTEKHMKSEVGRLAQAWAQVHRFDHGRAGVLPPCIVRAPKAYLGPCNWVFYGGYGDGSLAVHQGNQQSVFSPLRGTSMQKVQSARGHFGIVSCLDVKFALKSSTLYIVTGSTDSTVAIWNVHRKEASCRSLASNP